MWTWQSTSVVSVLVWVLCGSVGAAALGWFSVVGQQHQICLEANNEILLFESKNSRNTDRKKLEVKIYHTWCTGKASVTVQFSYFTSRVKCTLKILLRIHHWLHNLVVCIDLRTVSRCLVMTEQGAGDLARHHPDTACAYWLHLTASKWNKKIQLEPASWNDPPNFVSGQALVPENVPQHCGGKGRRHKSAPRPSSHGALPASGSSEDQGHQPGVLSALLNKQRYPCSASPRGFQGLFQWKAFTTVAMYKSWYQCLSFSSTYHTAVSSTGHSPEYSDFQQLC